MKKLIMIIIALLGCGQSFLFAQEIKPDSLQSSLSEKDILTYIALHTKSEENYKMYPTENMWTFLKLDTRTGKVWQVQYSVNSDTHGQVPRPIAEGDRKLTSVALKKSHPEENRGGILVYRETI